MQNLQQLASNPKFSCWVNASAGTGKTKVLIDRILRLLLNNVEPVHILCLTFSKAAAKEMHERLEKKLQDWSIKSDQQIEEELIAIGEEVTFEKVNIAKSLFKNKTNVGIQTVHSFCNVFLQKIFAKTDDDVPRILENFEEKIYLDLAFQKLLSAKNLEETLIDFLTFHTENVLFEYLCKSRNMFQDAAEEKILIRLKELMDIENFPIFPNLSLSLLELINNLFKIQIKNFEELEITDTFSQIFLTQKGEVRKKILPKNLQEEHPESEQILKDYAELLCNYFSQRARFQHVQKSLSFWKLQKEFGLFYNAIKVQKKLWDFNDLIYETLKIFKNDTFDEQLLNLSYSIHHLLVDEAQDTSAQQWEIIEFITKSMLQTNNENRTLFVVGDEKQLIYSFQGAEITTFERMRKYYAGQFNNWQEINLETSFRSAQKILDIVDNIFKNTETLSKSPIKHKANFDKNGELITLPLIEKVTVEYDEWPVFTEYQEVDSTEDLLAKQIIHTIENLKISSKEVMILMRKRGRMMKALEKQAKILDIPYTAIHSVNLLDKLVVKDLMSVVEFITMPINELNLAGLLRVPFMRNIGFISEEQLFDLCYKRTQNLWEVVQAKLPLHAAELNKILNSYFDNDYQIFTAAYDALNVEDIYLDAFMEEVFKRYQYLDLGIRGLMDSLNNFPPIFVNNIAEENATQILTVHSAKGLEAKTVFIIDDGDKPSLKQDVCLFDPVLGFWLLKPPKNIDTILTSSLKEYQQKVLAHEYDRLLYVAMTRAQEQLIICGMNHEPHEYSWYYRINSAINNFIPG